MAKEAAVIGIKKHQAIVNNYEAQIRLYKLHINDLETSITKWQEMNKILQADADEHLKTLTDLRDEIVTMQADNKKAFEDVKSTMSILHDELSKWKSKAESYRTQGMETQEKLHILQKYKWYHLLFGIKPKVRGTLTKEEIKYLQAEHEDIKSGVKGI